MTRRPSRRTVLTSAVMAGVLGLGGVVVGVAVPSSAQAESVELWRVAAQPDPLERYTAVVDAQHLVGDDVVRPAGPDPVGGAVLDGPGASGAETGTGGFDPAAVLRGTAVVGEPAALERVGGVLQLRGPRGVYVLDSDPGATQAQAVLAQDPPAGGAYARPSTPPDAVDPALLERLARAPGIERVEALHGGRVLLSVRRGTPPPAGLEGLRDIEPDAVGAVADVAGLPDDPQLPLAWALDNSGQVPGYAIPATRGADLGVLGAWSRTRGAGVTVAVLDTGYGGHHDLVGTLWDNDGEVCGGPDRDGNRFPGDCHGWNFTTGSADVTNASPGDPARNAHGTSVGSVIAGTLGNGLSAGGVAPDVALMPLVVGSGTSISNAYAIEALYYAADNGADVVNMSFGGNWGGTTGGRLFEDAMAYAAAKGVLLVAAAGNDGADIDGTGFMPATSANPSLLTVGASTAEDTRAGFSNHGRRTVDVYAPGMYVIAANSRGGTDLTSGTSIASPLTAGVAALLKSADLSLDGVALRRRVMETVAVRSAFASSATGGRVDARAALATVPEVLRIDVDGLAGLRPDVETPVSVRLSGTAAGLPAGPLGLRVRIVSQEPDGLAYDVEGVPVDGGPAGAGTTDGSGSVLLAPAGLTADAVGAGVTVPLSTTLPAGRYLALLSLTSGDRVVSPSSAAPFVVGSPSVAAPAPAAPSAAPSSAGSPPSTAPTTPGPGSPTTAPTAPAPEAPGPVPSSGPTSVPLPGTGPGAPDAPVPGGSGGPTPVPDVSDAPVVPAAPLPTTGPLPTGGPTTAPTAAPSTPGTAPAPAGPPPPAADAPVAPNGFGITHLSPGSGSTSGGQRVTLVGTRLPSGASVLFGGVPAHVVADDAPTGITVLTPARAAGPVDVTVYGPRADDLSGSRASEVLRDAFTYVEGTATPGPGPTSAPTAGPGAPHPGTSPAPTAGPAPDGVTPAPSAGPSVPGTRGSLRLHPAPDVAPVLFGHASCAATCTALRV